MYKQQIARVESIVKEQNEWRDLCINLIASEQSMSSRARAPRLRLLPSLR